MIVVVDKYDLQLYITTYCICTSVNHCAGLYERLIVVIEILRKTKVGLMLLYESMIHKYDCQYM